ncbi:hypothetical protein MHZ93_21880 [Roseomonas sp. ACRSG]|nr:hypothetical protein [Roseomonas sp. ACRSG]
MARTFTREEFYGLVWSKPLTQLSKDFFLSDVALHKICKKHGIPNPPLGWWAKKAAGKAVKQTPLPKAAAGDAGKITIASADLGPQSAVLANVREQARIMASAGADDQAIPSHPIVDRTLAKLRAGKPSDTGIVTIEAAGLIKCEVAASAFSRLAAILPRILHAVSLQGWALTAENGPAQFTSGAESLRFWITESVRREKHVLTAAERTRDEAWRRKRDQAARGRHPWDDVALHTPHFPEWDYHPTGLLSFELEHVYAPGGASPRRSFRDAKIQRLETMASDIAVGVAVLAAAKTARRLQCEEQQRQIEDARQRREAAARRAHIQERRITELGALLAELDELDRLQRLLAQLTAAVSVEAKPRLSAFLAWAQAHLADREKQLSAHGIEDRFANRRLFGDDDDHAFKLTGWY